MTNRIQFAFGKYFLENSKKNGQTCSTKYTKIIKFRYTVSKYFIWIILTCNITLSHRSYFFLPEVRVLFTTKLCSTNTHWMRVWFSIWFAYLNALRLRIQLLYVMTVVWKLACSPKWSITLFNLSVCLFVCPTREFFTHLETSPLPVKGCKFWPVLDTSEGSLACHSYCDTRNPFIMINSENPWHSHLMPSVEMSLLVLTT